MIQAEMRRKPRSARRWTRTIPLARRRLRAEEESGPAGRNPARDRSGEEGERSFDEIDFGSYFQDYLDPGFRSPTTMRRSRSTSIRKFSSPRPATLNRPPLSGSSGAEPLAAVRERGAYVIGNLNEDGYLTATGHGDCWPDICVSNGTGYTRPQQKPLRARCRTSPAMANGQGAPGHGHWKWCGCSTPSA